MTSTTDLAVRPLHLLTGEEPGGVDLPAAQRAAHDLLVALGADLTDESLADTPARVARMYAELLTPHPFNATTFPNDGGYDELGVAVAGMNINVWDVNEGIQALIRAGEPVSRARLVDPEIPLADLLPAGKTAGAAVANES